MCIDLLPYKSLYTVVCGIYLRNQQYILTYFHLLSDCQANLVPFRDTLTPITTRSLSHADLRIYLVRLPAEGYNTRNPVFMETNDILRLLQPFGLQLKMGQVETIQVYLTLLIKWNQKINLTAIRSEADCITRHFGESLYLSTKEKLSGRMVDVRSGAGFPGLALKIACPDLSGTLLEPSSKKRAFLKEIVRQCNFCDVRISPLRGEDFFVGDERQNVDIVTVRGLRHHEEIAAMSKNLLVSSGRLCLWLTRTRAEDLARKVQGYRWKSPLALPLTRERVILVGERESQD